MWSEPPLDWGDDVVDGEVAEGEHYFAASAKAFLFAEQGVLVGLVAGQLAQVGAAGNVVAVYGLEAEQAQLFLQAAGH